MKWPGVIRMARDDDGPGIGDLFAACQWNDYGIDWERAKPGGWWLVGERNDQIVGAVQLTVSRPFGWIGNLLVHPSERGRSDLGLAPALGSLAFSLMAIAQGMLLKNGSQVMVGITHDRTWLELLERYGAQSMGAATLTAKRIA